MITEYQITNFKAFGSPQTLPIRPITLIFGPNSSGKSSIFQSLLMLKQTIQQATGKTILLSKGNLVDLGSFREFIHAHDDMKQLSIKFTFPDPKERMEEIDEYITDPFLMENKSNALTELGNSLEEFKNTSLEFSFSLAPEKSSINLEKISLYLEEVNTTFIEFKANKENKLVLNNIDSNHRYWNSESRSALINKFKESEIRPFKFLKIENDQQSIKIEKLKEDHKKAYFPCIINEDFISLENFLPLRFNGEDLNEIYSGFIGYDVWLRNKINISILSLAISLGIKKLLLNIQWIGPLRQSPERYFTFSGLQTDYVGKSGENVLDMLISNPEIIDKVNKWVAQFEIGYELKVSFLSSTETEVQDLYFLRLFDNDSKVHTGLTDVGFGVSQILPVIVQSVVSQEKTILIEQPEYHLHPRLQAELGDLFIDSALGEQRNTFLIETHSEHLILRIMRRMRETFEDRLPEGIQPIRPEDVAIVYVEKDGDQSMIREMPLNERGELVKAWPGGFFEEGFREVMA